MGAKPFPRTLAEYVAAWIEENACHGPGDVYGERVRLTDEEFKLLEECYAIDQTTGRRLTDTAVYSRPKGTRKTEVAAWVALAETRGPVRAFFDDGRAVVGPVRDPYVVTVATTEDQADLTVYGALRAIIPASPRLEGLYDVGMERILLSDRPGKIDLLQTRNPGALDGAKPTFQVAEETHLWLGPTLIDAWGTLRRNLRKRKIAQPWVFCPTTSYLRGGESVLEALHESVGRAGTGQHRVGRLLYDHREASTKWNLDIEEELIAAILEAGGDAFWRDPEMIAADWDDPLETEENKRRYWLNQATSSANAWITAERWTELKDPSLLLEPGERVCLGFDGSLSRDATALVACRLHDGALFLLGLWQPGKDEMVNQSEVDSAVSFAFEMYDVERFYGDPPSWQDWMASWASRFNPQPGQKGKDRVFEWWTNRTKAMGEALERFTTAAATGTVSHDGNPLLAQHVLNARRDEVRGHMAIRKEKPWSPNKIDAAMAAVLAYEARADAITDGALAPKKSKRAYGFR
jgi:hypothetical protein